MAGSVANPTVTNAADTAISNVIVFFMVIKSWIPNYLWLV
jgi:hypothetical protein